MDRWLLEYDTERSGGFGPLRFMPQGKTVVLGLITSKEGRLEPQDLLLRRIEEASRYVPLERLAVSPQCGFATVLEGNQLVGNARDGVSISSGSANRVGGSQAGQGNLTGKTRN